MLWVYPLLEARLTPQTELLPIISQMQKKQQTLLDIYLEKILSPSCLGGMEAVVELRIVTLLSMLNLMAVIQMAVTEVLLVAVEQSTTGHLQRAKVEAAVAVVRLFLPVLETVAVVVMVVAEWST